MIVPEHLGPIVLVASLVVALGLVAFGVLGVVRRVKAIEKRFEGYRELSLFSVARLTQARVAAARRRVDTLPQMRARTLTATAEIETAFKRVRAIVQSVRFVVRKILAA